MLSDNQFLMNLLETIEHIATRLDQIDAKLDRLEKLIRVAAPHPLGEPK